MPLVSHHALEHLQFCFNLRSKICPEVKVIVILNLDKLLSNSLSACPPLPLPRACVPQRKKIVASFVASASKLKSAFTVK